MPYRCNVIPLLSQYCGAVVIDTFLIGVVVKVKRIATAALNVNFGDNNRGWHCHPR